LQLFTELLANAAQSVSVLVVHGPGGVGKSTLLAMMASRARADGATVAMVDGRDVEVTTPGLRAAVLAALEDGPDHVGRDEEARGEARRVLFIDAFEMVVALEDWFFGKLLADLPADVLVVLAGREPPGARVRADPGVRSITHVIALRNLPFADAERYLALEGLPVELAARVAAVAFGHPLALSLAVDLHRRGVIGDRPEQFQFGRVPDLVQALLQRLVDEVPSEHHRQALAVLALTRRTDQRLLRDLIEGSDSATLFDWLRSLSFVDAEPEGLVPHDLAREVLVADLRWRDQSAFDELHAGLFRHFIARARAASGLARQQATADAMHLAKHNMWVGANWDADALTHGYADRLRPNDADRLIEMARRHEGDESARLVRHWLDRQPDNVVVFRAPGPEPVGFVIHIALHAAAEHDFALDPGARTLWEYARRHGPPRPSEDVTVWTFNIDDAAYQQVATPTWTLGTVVHSQRHFALARPSWEFFVYRDADYWSGPMAFADLSRIPEADYELGGHRYAVFGRDWRVAGFDDWLELMAERMRRLTPDDVLPDERPPPLLVLDERTFADAVRAALRDLHRPDRLASNPLLRSRLVSEASGEGGDDAASRLRLAVERAAATLGQSPATAKYLRAVDRTYLRPAGTQERAAEVLDLPFSTYRRHLGRGVDAIIAALWLHELDPTSGARREGLSRK
jgi:hypothetical protein